MTTSAGVRIDGGEPVLEQHQLAVTPGNVHSGDVHLEVVCTGCGAHLVVEWDQLIPVNGFDRGLTVADLIWLAIEHRQQLAQEVTP